jgi:hypothetical protein
MASELIMENASLETTDETTEVVFVVSLAI